MQVQSRGLSSVAVLLGAKSWDWHAVDHVRQACSQRGLICHRRWIQGIPELIPGWAAHAVDGMFAGPEMPQALIIADDHLVPAATTALGDSDCRPLVIAMANFPLTGTQEVLDISIGWDQADYLREAMNRMARYMDSAHPIGNEPLPLCLAGDALGTRAPRA